MFTRLIAKFTETPVSKSEIPSTPDEGYDPQKAFARTDEEIERAAVSGLAVSALPFSLFLSSTLFDDWQRIALWTAALTTLVTWGGWNMLGDQLFNGTLNKDERNAGRERKE